MTVNKQRGGSVVIPISPLMPSAFLGYSGLSVEKGTGSDPVSFVKKLTEIINMMHEKDELSRIFMKYTDTDITRDARTFDIASLNQFNESYG